MPPPLCHCEVHPLLVIARHISAEAISKLNPKL